jgi:hypothetical protein
MLHVFSGTLFVSYILSTAYELVGKSTTNNLRKTVQSEQGLFSALRGG